MAPPRAIRLLTEQTFVPGANGKIAWFRLNGNLHRHMD
jgi:hypothetical protein